MNLGQTPLYKFEIFNQFHEVKHFVSGRNGGLSKGSCESLNLGFGTHDDPEVVLQNRYILSEATGIPLDWFVFPKQTHSANIKIVNNTHLGLGAFSRNNAIDNTDALITNSKNICIVIQVADCVPVLLFDNENSVIATIHAGWRGTAKEITKLTLEKMQTTFGTKPENIIAAIGPSIGKCCYEVGDEVIETFRSKSALYDQAISIVNKNFHLDLWKANELQLITSGVKQENIEIAGICTKCNSQLFFSSRQGNGDSGRFVAGIMLQ